MTMYGIPYLKVCLECQDEFAPTETSGENEFCSWDCEEEYETDQDKMAHYYYGRK